MKQVKDQPVSTRMSADMKEEVEQYVQEIEGMTIGKLIRMAVREYLWANPINITKKGEK